MAFSEVSGLEMEAEVIEYRDGLSPTYSAIKMPGLKKYTNITLRRGIYAGDNEFAEWFETIKLHTVERRDLTISLLDEEHNPAMTWKVKNAWPTKVSGPGLKATGNEVAIESMEIAHEGIEIETP
jgi:phage tail-like protein